jgi:hypothetical protein
MRMSAAAQDAVAPPTPEDAARVLGMIAGYQVSQAIYVAARLKLADLIAEGVDESAAIAGRAGAVPDRVHRLLRSLASFGLFTQVGEQRWALTPEGQTLRSDVPGSLRALALMWNEEHYEAFAGLIDAVTNDRPAFDQRFGTDWWTYLTEHPESARTFDAAMTTIGQAVQAAALAVADLDGVATLVDVGGGRGGLAAAFLARYPALHATVFDLPHVVAEVEPALAEAGVRERVTLVGGSFFDDVPAGADVYLLSAILHDWGDDEAGRILENVRRAIPDSGRLLIIDPVVPEGDTPHFAKLLDLNMLAMLTGRERTEPEFAALLKRAGFELERVTHTPSPTSLIEARPAAI